MPVTDDDATRAIELVLKTYGSYLPSGVASAIRGRSARDIVKILPANEYRPIFDEYYRSFFAAINSKAFGIVHTITIANADEEVCGSFNCPAFCSPAVVNTGRTIYVNKDEDTTFATVCHELCHYISHGNFYPEFYSMGGENPKILEGITEYLTRNLSREVSRERRDKQKYQAWYESVNAALIRGSQGDLAVIDFALKGKYVPLQGLGGVKPNI
jgi:hypothetical protein